MQRLQGVITELEAASTQRDELLAAEEKHKKEVEMLKGQVRSESQDCSYFHFFISSFLESNENSFFRV